MIISVGSAEEAAKMTQGAIDAVQDVAKKLLTTFSEGRIAADAEATVRSLAAETAQAIKTLFNSTKTGDKKRAMYTATMAVYWVRNIRHYINNLKTTNPRLFRLFDEALPGFLFHSHSSADDDDDDDGQKLPLHAGAKRERERGDHSHSSAADDDDDDGQKLLPLHAAKRRAKRERDD